jgi:hypothetical protein
MMRGNTFGCSQRREVITQIRMAQLHHPSRAGNTTQLISAQIGQPRIGGQRVNN